ncbi:carbon storage regulator [Vibrio phage vB_VpP_1]|nr:carbon storage regulator [Vibrio phage vB_VpP_1]
MLVLNRKARQKICIGFGLRDPNDDPEIVLKVVDVSSPYVCIEVEHLGEKTTHKMTPLDAERIGEEIYFQVVSVNYREVKLAFDAPIKYRILRGEL